MFEFILYYYLFCIYIFYYYLFYNKSYRRRNICIVEEGHYPTFAIIRKLLPHTPKLLWKYANNIEMKRDYSSQYR